MKKVAAIICAAGQSVRFGGKRKKPFVDVVGRAAFLRSVELFADRDDTVQILVAISPDEEELFKIRWGANLSFFGAQVCLGGEHRFETVANALKKLRDDIDLVAIHDAARCCVTEELIEKTIVAAQASGAAVPVCPVIPTLKQVTGEHIDKTISREGLFEAQTPQVIEINTLKKAYANLSNLDSSTISDDVQLVEALGLPVAAVPSDPYNLKITYPRDVVLAEAIIRSMPKPKPEGPTGPYNEAQW